MRQSNSMDDLSVTAKFLLQEYIEVVRVNKTIPSPPPSPQSSGEIVACHGQVVKSIGLKISVLVVTLVSLKAVDTIGNHSK